MLDDALKMVWRIMAFLIALFGAAYTIIYYMISISLIAAGVCFSFLVLCTFRAVFQSVVEHLPFKQYFDRRLQKNFIRKVKNMEYEEKRTRARLVHLMRDVKMWNEANNNVMKEIRANEAILRRKVRNFESCVVDRYQIHPTIPGVIVPPHQEPEAPSQRPIIRWLFAQSLELYYHKRSVANYEAQISGELVKLQQLEEEQTCLRTILDDTNIKRSNVQLLNDIPKPYRVSETTRKRLAQLDLFKFKPSPYPHFVPPIDYEARLRRLSPPPPRRQPEPPCACFGCPMFSMPAPAPLFTAPVSTYAPGPFSTSLFGPPPSAAPFQPLFGPPPSAAPLEPLFCQPPAAPTMAPDVPASGPPAENPLSLAERMTDPTGLRAPLPANPLSLAERMTDPTGLRAPLPASIFATPETIQSGQDTEAERRASLAAERELARDRKAARLGRLL